MAIHNMVWIRRTMTLKPQRPPILVSVAPNTISLHLKYIHACLEKSFSKMSAVTEWHDPVGSLMNHQIYIVFSWVFLYSFDRHVFGQWKFEIFYLIIIYISATFIMRHHIPRTRKWYNGTSKNRFKILSLSGNNLQKTFFPNLTNSNG
jgi:hypothetical protein